MKIGVLMLTTTRVARTLKDTLKKLLIVNGIMLSMLSTSLENLLIIRPIGVTSKKDMGAFKIRSRV